MEYFKLNNGNQVPVLCFGPGIMIRGFRYHSGIIGRIRDKIELRKIEKNYYDALLSAIEIGYRFIDYSATYGREDLIHKAIKESGIPRSEFVLTTRIPNKAQFDGNVEDVFKRSLDRLGVDNVDLLMFHWPVPDKYVDTWKQMINFQEKGLCVNLGVANCHAHHLNSLIKTTGIVPQIDQIELHPLFSQKELLSYCKEKRVRVQAYTSLARMDERMCRLPKLKNLANKYGKSIPQIVLRWHIQNGVVPIFRSLNYERLKSNIQLFDFKLSDSDMEYIDSININSRLRYNPDNCDFSIL